MQQHLRFTHGNKSKRKTGGMSTNDNNTRRGSTRKPLPPPPSLHLKNRTRPQQQQKPITATHAGEDEAETPKSVTMSKIPPPPPLPPFIGTRKEQSDAAEKIQSSPSSPATDVEKNIMDPLTMDLKEEEGSESVSSKERSVIKAEVRVPEEVKPVRSTADNRLKRPSPLAARQRTIPILVLPTASANSTLCVEKNGVTIGQLLGAVGGSLVGLNISFRSVSRSLLLDTVDLRFVDAASCCNVLIDQKNKDDKLDRIVEDRFNQIINELPEDDGNIPDQEIDDRILGELKHSREDRRHDSSSQQFVEEQSDADLRLQDAAERGAQLLATADLPWFRRLRLLMDTMTDHMPHDMIGCPIVCMIVASTSDENYIECFRELMVTHHLPKPYNLGHYDPGVSLKRYFVLLHDNVDGPKDFDDQYAIDSFHNSFPGQSFRVLRINSVVSNSLKNHQPDLWVDDVLDISLLNNDSNKTESAIRGESLSPEDMLAIRSLLFDFTKSCVVPEMERRIFNLNVEVSNTKRGARNFIKSLWRKPKDSDDEALSGLNRKSSSYVVKYTHNQIESKVRLLADSLFLMKDFDAALSNYRLVKDDYKADKAKIHFGSINEMIALCLYMLHPNGKRQEIYSCVEAALLSYSSAAEDESDARSRGEDNVYTRPSAGSLPTRLASRLSLVVCGLNICDGRHYAYAECLGSSSVHETSVISAVLLEQAASHYFQASMFRKYAFHLIMSGHMYRSTNKQEKHAARCFTAALQYYQSSRWNHLYTHIQSSLAHQAFALNKWSLSLQIYSRVVGSTGTSPKVQQKVLQNLFNICKHSPSVAMIAAKQMQTMTHDNISEKIEDENSLEALELPCMDLPKVFDHTISIAPGRGDNFRNTNDNNRILRESSSIVIEDEDTSINADLVESFRAEMAIKVPTAVEYIKKLDEIKKDQFSSKKSKGDHVKTIALEEPFVVSLHLFNPLSIPLTLNRVQLVAKYEDGVVDLGNGFNSNNSSKPKENRCWNFKGSDEIFHCPDLCFPPDISTNPHFVVTKQTIEMNPKDVVPLNMNICPLLCGKLSIIGMRFKLFGQVWIFHQFRIPGPFLRNTREQRAKRVRGKSNLMNFVVENQMPRLVLSIDGGKGAVLQGEVLHWKLRVRNVGSAPANNLLMKSNYPWLYLYDDTIVGSVNSAVASSCGISGTLMKLPLSKAIEPGEVQEYTLKVRAGGGGRQSLNLIMKYEKSEKDLSDVRKKERFVMKTISFTVYPSINIFALCNPSCIIPGEYILSVEITNYRSDDYSDEEIELTSMSICSKRCRVSLIPGQLGEGNKITLGSQERKTIHFLVHETPEIENDTITFSEVALSTGDPVGSSIKENAYRFLCLASSNSSLQASVAAHREKMARIALDSSDKPRSIHDIRRANQGQNDTLDPAESLQSIGNDHPLSVASLCTSNSNQNLVNVVCKWKTAGVVGEHFVKRLSIRSQERVDSPLVITAKYAKSLHNDFATKPKAETGLIVKIENHHQKPVKFIFRMLSRENMHFVGFECFTWTLKEGGDVVIPITVHFFKEGIFDIQCVKVTIVSEDDRNGDVREEEFLFDQQWIVKVN